MRTKTLLLTAACAVIGAVAASAQSVYSVNAVGYVNLTVPKGNSIIANPLNTGSNTLSQVLPSVPDDTMLYLWTGTQLKAYKYLGAEDGWSTPNAVWAPGAAAWIKNSSGAAMTITFVGEVPQGSLTNKITAGVSFKASIVPQSGALDTVLGYTPSDDDMIYLWKNATSSWKICKYLGSEDGWSSSPAPAVGEGFWVKTSAAKDWVRTFDINK
jgi:hypothetical protein